jgi:hypothetical protein
VPLIFPGHSRRAWQAQPQERIWMRFAGSGMKVAKKRESADISRISGNMNVVYMYHNIAETCCCDFKP